MLTLPCTGVLAGATRRHSGIPTRLGATPELSLTTGCAPRALLLPGGLGLVVLGLAARGGAVGTPLLTLAR